jgi:SulP family sulfate permease
MSTALAHAPENAAYGLIALAPLGLAFGPTAMALALLGTVVANIVASVGGAGRLVGGQRAALALLTAGFVAALSARLAANGSQAIGTILFLLAVGVVGAGALQVAFGLLKLGTLVKFTPHPVRVGVTSGVGLVLIINALPVIAGHDFGVGWSSGVAMPKLGAALVGMFALAVTWATTRWRGGPPPVLLGLAAAALLHALLSRVLPVGSLGALIGVPTLSENWLPPFVSALPDSTDLLNRSVLGLVGIYALTVAVLCSLDTLLATSVIDGRLRQGRDANRELAAQGFATIASGLVGGQPAPPSIPRSLALLAANDPPRHAVLVYALASILVLLFAPRLLGLLPSSALAGVLLLQGVQMVAPAFWRAPLELWRLGKQHKARGSDGDSGQRRALGANWAVELAVSLSAVAFGLGPAVLIGASFAILLFVRANMRDVVRREWTGETRRSLKTRPSNVAQSLRLEGRRIAVLELEGSLFFGTADGLRARLEALEASVDEAILDLHQVMEMDVTAARILFETAQDWARDGRQLVFSEWGAGDARRRVIEAMGTPSERSALRFADNTDLALEHAEDRLLERLARQDNSSRTLTLAETMIGRGLDADELALLSARLRTLHFARGAVLFTIGDPGDGLYISLEGDIGLRIPGTTRRLASFAPGVTIGEMAMLAHGTRSAEAVAESDVMALHLPVEAFDRLMSEHPALAAKLLKNMSLHLADRVRVLTGDLAGWVSRAAAGGPVAALSSVQSLRVESESID